MLKEKDTPVSSSSQLKRNWLPKVKIQYQALSNEIFSEKLPERLSELLYAIDYHATHNPSYNDDIGLDVGYGQQLTYGVIPVNLKTNKDSLDVKSYVAVAVTEKDNKVLLLTADDQDRLDLYMGLNKIEADIEDFKSSEVLVVLKDLQKEHGIKDDDICYVNYTLSDLESRASTYQSPSSRGYMRFNLEQIGGRHHKWNDVVYDNAAYLCEKLAKSPVAGIAYSKKELNQIKEIANNMVSDEKAENQEFQLDGHDYDVETGINKIVFNRLLVKSLGIKSKQYADAIKEHLPKIDKNANVRITCGDHKATQKIYWNSPEQILEALHQAGLEDLTIDDIVHNVEVTKRTYDKASIKAAAEEIGIEYADMKNTSFGIYSGTNTKIFKEHFKDNVEADILSISESIDSKMDMYEPGDEEINNVTTADEAGYGVTPS